jgi:hypothetical protein
MKEMKVTIGHRHRVLRGIQEILNLGFTQHNSPLHSAANGESEDTQQHTHTESVEVNSFPSSDDSLGDRFILDDDYEMGDDGWMSEPLLDSLFTSTEESQL